MIAALQMYDWPEVQGRTDAFWARVHDALSEAGIDAPAALSRPERLSQPWTDPGLLIGQTCGLPYVAGRCGDAVLIGRPDYGIEGASGGSYASAIICRREDEGTLADCRGQRAVINEFGSQSGCNALADEVQRMKLDREGPFFGTLELSGAHRSSAQMVADGGADIAAIDAVAWALFQELEPERHARLRVIGWTRAMPALPFITGAVNAPRRAALYDALLAAALASCEWAGKPGPVGIPIDMLPAEDADYDPIRKMAERIKGMRLAPDAPTL